MVRSRTTASVPTAVTATSPPWGRVMEVVRGSPQPVPETGTVVRVPAETETACREPSVPAAATRPGWPSTSGRAEVREDRALTVVPRTVPSVRSTPRTRLAPWSTVTSWETLVEPESSTREGSTRDTLPCPWSGTSTSVPSWVTSKDAEAVRMEPSTWREG